MFCGEDGRLFVETFGASYEASLREFVVCCAEPVSRPEFVNEFVLTPASLSAASSEGTYKPDDVRRVLLDSVSRKSRDDELPGCIETMIRDELSSEKIQLVLAPDPADSHRAAAGKSRENQTSSLVYCLQSADRNLLDAFVVDVKNFLLPFRLGADIVFVISDVVPEQRADTARRLMFAGMHGGRRGMTEGRLVYTCRIKPGCQRQVKEALYARSIRVVCSYDFLRDSATPTVPNFSLRLGVRLRPYQAASLERFQRGDKAHNGVVVLPCGAGKTLTGIAASCIVGKRTIVMCCNVLSVMQWRNEFLRWTDLREDQVTVCVRGLKQRPGDIFITTYSMLTAQRAARPADAVVTEDALLTKTILNDITTATWGVLLLDEVHIAPAHRFQEVINCVRHHCVLGLSATLLREDQRIDNLRFLVGPKLYEANWLELTNKGFLANVVCMDVRCPMPPTYLRMYLDPASSDEALRDISCVNPYKLWVTQALLHFHGSRSPPDKTIIFCDSIAALEFFAATLHIPFMDGRTPEGERAKLLHCFKNTSTINTIILSRVGDIALDIPEASVIIQLSGLGASRRQEAQRLGRILRPKPASVDSASAYFYTLVSEDTDESRNAFGRQEWLRDQGFAYRMLPCRDILRHYEPALESCDGAARRSRLLCVGPPLWYWRSDGSESEFFINAVAHQKGKPGDRDVVGQWRAFSRSHSIAIDEGFRRGAHAVPLPLSSVGHSVKHASSSSKSALRVVFSAADAPITFGTVLCEAGHADNDGGSTAEQHPTERRIAKHLWHEPLAQEGREKGHNCIEHDECLGWLLQCVGESREQRGAKRGRDV